MTLFRMFKPFLHNFKHSNNYYESSIKYKKLFSSNTVYKNNDSTSYPNVKAFKHQHITLISLNRPDDKNRLNTATLEDLKKAISDFENDSLSTIAVLYGEGGSFCSGWEPEELIKAPQIFNDFTQSHCKKPIIAAISGFAYDVGFDLCLWCDMRIVEENAVLAVNRKTDIPKSKIFLNKLLTTVGYSRAMDLLLTGRDLNSKEAFECGVANRIVACGSGVGQAVNLASNIGKFPQQSVNIDRCEINKILLKQLKYENN